MFTEEHDRIILSFDLPGYSLDDIDVKINENHISIIAKKDYEKKHEEAGFSGFEKSSNSFMYDSVLPNVDKDKANITFNDGRLEIEIPKM